MDHYHRKRNHWGLENRLIHASTIVSANDGAIYRHARLGEYSICTTAKRREQHRSNKRCPEHHNDAGEGNGLAIGYVI